MVCLPSSSFLFVLTTELSPSRMDSLFLCRNLLDEIMNNPDAGTMKCASLFSRALYDSRTLEGVESIRLSRNCEESNGFVNRQGFSLSLNISCSKN